MTPDTRARQSAGHPNARRTVAPGSPVVALVSGVLWLGAPIAARRDGNHEGLPPARPRVRLQADVLLGSGSPNLGCARRRRAEDS